MSRFNVDGLAWWRMSLADASDIPGPVAVLGDGLRFSCFGGDEPYDAARRKEIASAMKKYRCDRLDTEDAVLRKRYKDNHAALAVLQKAHEW